MARPAKVYKRNTQQKRKQKSKAVSSTPSILPVQTAEEKVRAIDFNYRVREDLLDRL
jgi:hypothetical protein